MLHEIFTFKQKLEHAFSNITHLNIVISMWTFSSLSRFCKNFKSLIFFFFLKNLNVLNFVKMLYNRDISFYIYNIEDYIILYLVVLVQVIVFVQKKFIKAKFDKNFHLYIFYYILLLKRNLQTVFWIERTFCNIYIYIIYSTCSTRRNSNWEILPNHLFLKILSSLKKCKIYVEGNFFSWLFSNKIGLIIKEDPR